MLTGENGIIAKAREAKEKTEIAGWEERIDLAIIEVEGEKRNPTLEDVIDKLYDNDIIDDKENDVNRETGAITTNEPEYVIEGKLDSYLGSGVIEEATAEIEVIERNETSIKVKVNGDNLNTFQFSMDGTNYSIEQKENEYTFENLTKVVVDKTNYKTTTGTEYTLYAKAKSNSGNEIICEPITTSTVVEVQGDPNDFLYEDLGEEIYIYSVSRNTELPEEPTEEALDELISNNQILIPSYINGKPVRYVSDTLLKECFGGLLSDIEDPCILYIPSLGYNKVECELDETGAWRTTVYIPRGSEDEKYKAYLLYGKTYYGVDEVSYSNPDIALELDEKNSEIILPPTIKCWVSDESISSYMNISNKTKNNFEVLNSLDILNKEQKLRSDILPGQIVSNCEIYINTLIDGFASTCNMYILGRDNAYDIENNEILLNSSKWSNTIINFVN